MRTREVHREGENPADAVCELASITASDVANVNFLAKNEPKKLVRAPLSPIFCA